MIYLVIVFVRPSCSSCRISWSYHFTSAPLGTRPRPTPAGVPDAGGEDEREGGAVAGLARHLDRAAVRFGDAGDEVQPEAAPLNLARHRFAAAIERLEDVLAILGRDAEAAIRHGDGHV